MACSRSRHPRRPRSVWLDFEQPNPYAVYDYRWSLSLATCSCENVNLLPIPMLFVGKNPWVAAGTTSTPSLISLPRVRFLVLQGTSKTSTFKTCGGRSCKIPVEGLDTDFIGKNLEGQKQSSSMYAETAQSRVHLNLFI